MYRLKAKIGKSWRTGWNVYESYEEAEKRKEKMESAGCKVKIVESDF